jgi:tripartite-type tricarboxylate transporter receptor subunit TctC
MTTNFAHRIGHVCRQFAALTLFTVAAIANAQAQEWPNRVVRIIVPYPAGGSADFMVRIAADQLTKRFNQPFVIENRGGAGGMIGTEAAIRAPKDGYTLFFASGSVLSVLPLTQKVSFDPLKELVPISIFGENSQGVAVSSKLGITNVRQLIDFARANPGKVNYANAGFGTTSHLAPAAFAAREKLDMVAIPYQGGGNAVTAVVRGDAHFYFGNTSDSVAQSRAGNVRLIAISAPKRKPQLPDVPTISETVPGFVIVNWNGFFAPAGVPAGIIRQLEQAIVEICQDPETIARLGKVSIEAVGATQEETIKSIQRELPVYAAAIDAAGLRLK